MPTILCGCCQSNSDLLLTEQALFIPTEFLPTPDFILYFLSFLYFLFFNMETGLFYIGQPDLDLIREPRLASALSSCLCLLSTRITSTLGEVRVSESLYIASVQPVL